MDGFTLLMAGLILANILLVIYIWPRIKDEEDEDEWRW